MPPHVSVLFPLTVNFLICFAGIPMHNLYVIPQLQLAYHRPAALCFVARPETSIISTSTLMCNPFCAYLTAGEMRVISGHTFNGFGAQCDNYPCAYLTAGKRRSACRS